jgi:hypothetical protein
VLTHTCVTVYHLVPSSLVEAPLPANPRWLLAIPDAVAQLEALDHELLTRRDLERLLGVRRAHAATLMRTFGAGKTGNVRTLPKTQLLKQLRARRKGAVFSGEVQRRERVLDALHQARISGIRARVPASVMSLRLAGLPDGVTVEPGRIEVRFTGAKEAVGRLFALAQALTNDFERFETIVEGGVASVEPEGDQPQKREGEYHALLKALDVWESKKQAGETIGDDDIIESLGVRGRVKLFALRDRRRGETRPIRPVGGNANPNDA